MITNRINSKGFVTEGLNDGTATTIISGAQFIGNVTFAGDITVAGSASIASPISGTNLAKYEAYQATGSQAFSGDAVHSVVRMNGGLQNIQHGLHLWNTASHIFRPTEVGRVYFMRLDGILSASAGSPYLHIDFELSGGISTVGASHHSSASLHRQSVEVAVVKAAGTDHSHFHATFMCFSDQMMITSGAQFYGAIDTAQIVSFKSCSLMIHEH
jgi:hypothetical protein